jgi:hypothetical protein
MDPVRHIKKCTLRKIDVADVADVAWVNQAQSRLGMHRSNAVVIAQTLAQAISSSRNQRATIGPVKPLLAAIFSSLRTSARRHCLIA